MNKYDLIVIGTGSAMNIVDAMAREDVSKRHRDLSKMVLEIFVKGETITEKDWWEVIWRNVPFHGAPGG